jgi:hypothetical protein
MHCYRSHSHSRIYRSASHDAMVQKAVPWPAQDNVPANSKNFLAAAPGEYYPVAQASLHKETL